MKISNSKQIYLGKYKKTILTPSTKSKNQLINLIL